MDVDLVSSLRHAYPAIKGAHVALVGMSGLLFVVRAVGVLAKQAWPMRPLARRASVGIDVLLLSAGVTLWMILELNPVRDTWLGVKLLLLAAYIAAGSVAMRRGRTTLIRLIAFVVAICLYTAIVWLASFHRTIGFEVLWLQL